jgi:hypothetical protein
MFESKDFHIDDALDGARQGALHLSLRESGRLAIWTTGDSLRLQKAGAERLRDYLLRIIPLMPDRPGNNP